MKYAFLGLCVADFDVWFFMFMLIHIFRGRLSAHQPQIPSHMQDPCRGVL